MLFISNMLQGIEGHYTLKDEKKKHAEFLEIATKTNI